MRFKSAIVGSAVVVLLSLIMSLVLDRALILIGFPSEIRSQVTHPPNKTKHYKNMEFEFTFTTNSEGLRNPEIPLKKAGEEMRILMAGDSMVEGVGMELDQTLPAMLEKELRSGGGMVTVINGGLSGAAPVNYGRLALHLFEVYEIDAVLIALSPNDVYETNEDTSSQEIYLLTPSRSRAAHLVHVLWPRMYPLTRRATRWLGRLEYPWMESTDILSKAAMEAEYKGIDPSRIETWKRNVSAWLETLTPKEKSEVLKGHFAWSSLTYGLSSPDSLTTSIDIDSESADRKWTAMEQVLEEMIVAFRKRGIQMAFIYIPLKFQYDPASHGPLDPVKVGGTEIRASWLHDRLEIDRRLGSFAERTGVPFLNLTPAFRQLVEEGEKLNWRYDAHLSPSGNHFASQAIAEWLRAQNIFEQHELNN